MDLRCIWEHIRVRRGSWEDGLGDFIASVGGIGDLEVNAGVCAVGGKASIRSCILVLMMPCAKLVTYWSHTPRRGLEG